MLHQSHESGGSTPSHSATRLPCMQESKRHSLPRMYRKRAVRASLVTVLLAMRLAIRRQDDKKQAREEEQRCSSQVLLKLSIHLYLSKAHPFANHNSETPRRSCAASPYSTAAYDSSLALSATFVEGMAISQNLRVPSIPKRLSRQWKYQQPP